MGRNTVADDYTLPDWLDIPAWEAWCEHRKLIATARRPWTPLVWKRGLAQLIRLHEQGYDHVHLIDKSILSGWLGFFPDEDARVRRSRETSVTDLRLVQQDREVAAEGLQAAKERLHRG